MVAVAIAIAIIFIVVIIYLLVRNSNLNDEIEQLTRTGERLKKENAKLKTQNSNLSKEIERLIQTEERLRNEISELTEQAKELRDKISMLEYQTYHLRAQSHTLKNLAQNVQDSISHLYRRSSDITDIMGILSFKTANSNRRISVKEETETIKKYVNVIRDIKNIKGTCIVDTSDIQTSSPFYTQKSILEFISFPLVENAFQHGDTKADDFLRIKYSLFDNIFSVEVKNKINELEIDEENKKYSGQGIEILRHRLEQFYPNKFKLESGKQNHEYRCYLQVIIDEI